MQHNSISQNMHILYNVDIKYIQVYTSVPSTHWPTSTGGCAGFSEFNFLKSKDYTKKLFISDIFNIEVFSNQTKYQDYKLA